MALLAGSVRSLYQNLAYVSPNKHVINRIELNRFCGSKEAIEYLSLT